MLKLPNHRPHHPALAIKIIQRLRDDGSGRGIIIHDGITRHLGRHQQIPDAHQPDDLDHLCADDDGLAVLIGDGLHQRVAGLRTKFKLVIALTEHIALGEAVNALGCEFTRSLEIIFN